MKAWTYIGSLVLGATLAATPALSATRPSTERIVAAIHKVETGGRTGRILGDGGRALGPLQIHRGYWLDAGVPGKYEDCTDLAYSVKVFESYMRRYERAALERGDAETLARAHNGGCGWRRNPRLTDGYWRKVKGAMK